MLNCRMKGRLGRSSAELRKGESYMAKNPKLIAVTSGKGGTGKSTICYGLGYTLAKQGHRTLIIELDFGLR